MKSKVGTVGLHIINGKTHLNVFRDRGQNKPVAHRYYRPSAASVARVVKAVFDLTQDPRNVVVPGPCGWTFVRW